jgi:hypothetical protein
VAVGNGISSGHFFRHETERLAPHVAMEVRYQGQTLDTSNVLKRSSGGDTSDLKERVPALQLPLVNRNLRC